MHADYTMLMSVVLDSEATADEMQRLREHLRACAACASVWERWQAADRRLGAAPRVAPAPTFTESVMARIAAQSLRQRRARWLGSGLLGAWLVGSLSGLAVIGALVYWGSQYQGQASGAFFAALKGVDSATWILLDLLRLMGGVDAPALAAGVGLLATLTCLLGMLWLWLVGRGQTLTTEPMSAL